ncbi:unnamed protein product [Peniophora sp. CBMAI 1063]|nr:unnamed protein product [Peniophora sp. CBMAI 1063]
MDDHALAVARDHNARASINRKLSNEILCDIFLALALLDIPSLERPQGWFLQVNGVCRRWRYVAVGYAELWGASAGSFPSDDMTDLAISRARGSLLRLDGHFEDHSGPGYVLTEYQLSLIEKHHDRLRSLVHDDYLEWPELLYRLKSFPKLEMARIWDDPGPNRWDASVPIDVPLLRGLYMNNVLVPFSAPALRHLRVDMDNRNWRASEKLLDPDESLPILEGCEAIPRVFPAREFIEFLKRSPLLERLIITDMPLLCAEDMPSVFDFYADLPRLRVLHLGGKSLAMGDFVRRLRVVQSDVQIFIDTDVLEHGKDDCEPTLAHVIAEWIRLPIYDSLRLSRTPSYDLLMQMWSSEATNTGPLDYAASLGATDSPSGPAVSFRLPSLARNALQRDAFNHPYLPLEKWELSGAANNWQGERYRRNVARIFYERAMRNLGLDRPFHRGSWSKGESLTSPSWALESFSTVKYLDYTDAPSDGAYSVRREGQQTTDIEQSHLVFRACHATHITVNWSYLGPLPPHLVASHHFTPVVEHVTLVNFPCAGFSTHKRYDEETNAEAWSKLQACLKTRHESGQPPLALRLAESDSDMSNMARSFEPEYVHTLRGSYKDAVRAVTQTGYKSVAPYLKGFDDLRIHTL